MKPEEIQLGDWLRYEYTEGGEEEGEIEYYEYDFRVNQIYFGMGTQEVSGEDGDIYDIADVQPIPITPEILEKNGFEKLDFSHFHIKDRTLVLDADGKWKGPLSWHWVVTEMDTNAKGQPVVIDYYVATINYIHELQHALRLCGIEKEIVL